MTHEQCRATLQRVTAEPLTQQERDEYNDYEHVMEEVRHMIERLPEEAY